MKKLQKVSFKNFKGLDKIQIEINAPTYYIVGPNGSGKTTILQAIWYALQGKCGFGTAKKKDRYQFIKPGASAAATEVEIYDTEKEETIHIKRSFTKTTEHIEIVTADGNPLDKAYLDGLLDHFCFDIQHFARKLSPVEQSKVFGIDTSSVDEKLKDAKRLLSDRNKKKLALQDVQRAKEKALFEKGREIFLDFEDVHQEIKRVNTQDLQDWITQTYSFNQRQEGRAEAIRKTKEKIANLEAELEKEKSLLETLPPPEALKDDKEIQEKLAHAESVNKLADHQEANQKHTRQLEEAIGAWETARNEYKALEAERVKIIQAGKDTIAAGKLNTHNIDFDESGGLMIDGRYLNEDNFNTAELIKKSIVIVNRFKKPNFPLYLIKNASLLDKDESGEVKLFNDLQKVNENAQFICEIVGTEAVTNGILLTQETKKEN